MPRTSEFEIPFSSNRLALLRLCAMCLLAIGALSVLPGARAEHLPIKTYTTADGLAHNHINRIRRDSRGFLWFCTDEGLSRYDGYGFANFGMEQGLPNERIQDLLELPDGTYLVATGEGLARFNPRGKPFNLLTGNPGSKPPAEELMFATHYPGPGGYRRFITVLSRDRGGSIWCGTQAGLFKLRPEPGKIVFEPVEYAGTTYLHEQAKWVFSLLEDRFGTLWIGSATGLYCIRSNGQAAHYGKNEGVADGGIVALLEDQRGDLWASIRIPGREAGLKRLLIDSAQSPPIVVESLSNFDDLAVDTVTSLFQTEDGIIWAATGGGLCKLSFDAVSGGRRIDIYAAEHGLSNPYISALLGDADGNLWLGTRNGGVMKLAREGFLIFDKADDIFSINSIIANASGSLYLIGVVWKDRRYDLIRMRAGIRTTVRTYDWRIGAFDGHKFEWVRPNVPELTYFGWGWNQITFRDHAGEWWVTTGKGLYRFPAVASLQELGKAIPKAIYTTAQGLADNDIFRLYEDSRGDIWIASFAVNRGLARWERSTETISNIKPIENSPFFRERVPISFVEDRSGGLWMGFSIGGLACWKDGRFKFYTTDDGLPAGWIYDLHIDGGGRLWIASTLGGVGLLAHPEIQKPDFTIYTTANGLSSNHITCLTEDRQGRIYLGTGRGIDRLDKDTGRIRQLTDIRGIPLGEVNDAVCDANGVVWFGTSHGLMRLSTSPDRWESSPPIYLTSVSVSGTQVPLSVVGETRMELPLLSADQRQIQIGFVGLSLAFDEKLRYQYRLEGAGVDWTNLNEQRSLTFANLSPGGYRLFVRAMNSQGMASAQPAVVTFRILRPVWQRWWFVALAALGVGLTAFAFYRSRIQRVLELERMRMRIATDLHDDIGASLSQIAILSEVSRQRLGNQPVGIGETLAQIAGTSRDLVDSMSDIVWATNPRRDRVSDLTQRMREFAGDVLTAREIEFSFGAPADGREIHLDAELRRQIYLVFKEAVNNAARHARCTEVQIRFEVTEDRILLTVRDNGRGFDPAVARDGNGLKSLAARAKALGGEIEIRTHPGGTTIEFHLQLNRRQRPKWRRYLPV